MKDEPRLIEGGLSIDDRGQVAFCNGFNPAEAGVKRLYVLSNHEAGYVRAWHGHKIEAKYVLVTRGVALVCCVVLEEIEQYCQTDAPSWSWVDKSTMTLTWSGPPTPIPQAWRFVLSGQQPKVLYIPPGYANGHMALSVPCDMVHFSSMTIEEAKGDDLRFPARCIPGTWEVEEK
jgi:dTDP-4-dehydrorhamnose 3,5-epimerase